MIDQYKLKRAMAVLEMMEDQYEESPVEEDVSKSYLRDEKGRFTQKEPVEEWKLRDIRIKKVRGSYGTYNVYDGELFVRAVGIICIIGLLTLALIVL